MTARCVVRASAVVVALQYAYQFIDSAQLAGGRAQTQKKTAYLRVGATTGIAVVLARHADCVEEFWFVRGVSFAFSPQLKHGPEHISCRVAQLYPSS